MSPGKKGRKRGSGPFRDASRIFLRGVVVIVPATITVYALYWVFALLESGMRGLLSLALPEQLYFPGMGIVFLVLVIFGAGVAIRETHVERTFTVAERNLLRVPVLKSIYSVSKDFMEYVASDRKNRSMGQVVAVSFAEADCMLVGFMTEEHPGKHSPLLEQSDMVAVYLPMGYQIGGYTMIVDRARVQTLQMSFEDAMRFILTAGVSQTTQTTAARSA